MFVSVTGTPSGIVLQNIDNRSRPSFVEMLEPGKEYVGGDVFFSKLRPQAKKLITLTDKEERIELLGKDKKKLPEGLKNAIRLFLLAAAAASEKLGWPMNGQGYKFLCHPSVRNADQEKVADRIRNYLVELTKALNDPTCSLYRKLKTSYDSLKGQTPGIPPFNSLSLMNRKRIRATRKNGGSANRWRKELLPQCYDFSEFSEELRIRRTTQNLSNQDSETDRQCRSGIAWPRYRKKHQKAYRPRVTSVAKTSYSGHL